ncbi:RING-4 like protein [Metarhizium acridum CQMa 102]|uniref:RING-4 like protein n=1 Tax=Metarhizium acridum (strain CQMa 102) TaxID=655827 RepID=E9EGZ4_METAQ|nr:RING-4 like protein [Metarhizium acridum CQMa 102]EFY84820.1 RING-4 like protein [Metarhizium acridum CQMa 102]
MSSDGRRRKPGNTVPKSQAGAKRFQVPRACERCKSLRRGCEERRPCSRCVRAGAADDCVGPSRPSWTWTPSSPSGEWAQVADVAGSPAVTECAALFFEHCFPTIPIVTPEYISRLQRHVAAHDGAVEASVLLVALCAYVVLHVDEPPSTHATVQTQPDVAVPPPGHGLVASGQGPPARGDGADGADVAVWQAVLGPLGLGTIPRHPLRTLHHAAHDAGHAGSGRSQGHRDSFPGLWSLAVLFRPIDSAFMAVMNREAASWSPSPEILDAAERSINTAIPARFPLQDMQKANLRITQLWLRIVIWQLRLRLGYLTDMSHQRSLTYQYPLDVARELVLSTRDLPARAMTVHGVGLTEKLFDIASAVVDVMAQAPRQRHTEVEGPPEDDLGYIRGLVVQLPGGKDVYDGLLARHVEQALHSPLQNQAVPSRRVDESPI